MCDWVSIWHTYCRLNYIIQVDKYSQTNGIMVETCVWYTTFTRSFSTLFENFKYGGEPWLYKNLQTLRQFHTPTPLKGLSFLYSWNRRFPLLYMCSQQGVLFWKRWAFTSKDNARQFINIETKTSKKYCFAVRSKFLFRFHCN